jgi:type II secretory ATPase GspE/PulE/Tfp pilus assembly ATPase PilB-like protein
MVGEIRDNETAKIAVNAAMTGHLVLSTLHANNASTTFPRLLDMGVEPFLVSSSVNVVIAQRLVRNICDNCKTSFLLNKENIKFLEDEPEVTKQIKQAAGKKSIDGVRTYQGEGCKMCGGTGYKGRTAIFEVMEVTDELRELITQKASADILAKKANELKMTTMLEDGISKVIQGTTTIEEVLRATKS